MIFKPYYYFETGCAAYLFRLRRLVEVPSQWNDGGVLRFAATPVTLASRRA